jgi:hypothetical protein
MSRKFYTAYETNLFQRTFDAMKQEGFFKAVIMNKTLPFAVNQDEFGAYNLGFFMWQAGREDVLEQVIGLLQESSDVDEALAKLLAIRSQQASHAAAEEVQGSTSIQ